MRGKSGAAEGATTTAAPCRPLASPTETADMCQRRAGWPRSNGKRRPAEYENVSPALLAPMPVLALKGPPEFFRGGGGANKK
jgi:hypothetical protein